MEQSIGFIKIIFRNRAGVGISGIDKPIKASGDSPTELIFEFSKGTKASKVLALAKVAKLITTIESIHYRVRDLDDKYIDSGLSKSDIDRKENEMGKVVYDRVDAVLFEGKLRWRRRVSTEARLMMSPERPAFFNMDVEEIDRTKAQIEQLIKETIEQDVIVGNSFQNDMERYAREVEEEQKYQPASVPVEEKLAELALAPLVPIQSTAGKLTKSENQSSSSSSSSSSAAFLFGIPEEIKIEVLYSDKASDLKVESADGSERFVFPLTLTTPKTVGILIKCTEGGVLSTDGKDDVSETLADAFGALAFKAYTRAMAKLLADSNSFDNIAIALMLEFDSEKSRKAFGEMLCDKFFHKLGAQLAKLASRGKKISLIKQYVVQESAYSENAPFTPAELFASTSLTPTTLWIEENK